MSILTSGDDQMVRRLFAMPRSLLDSVGKRKAVTLPSLPLDPSQQCPVTGCRDIWSHLPPHPLYLPRHLHTIRFPDHRVWERRPAPPVDLGPLHAIRPLSEASSHNHSPVSPRMSAYPLTLKRDDLRSFHLQPPKPCHTSLCQVTMKRLCLQELPMERLC